MLENWEFQWTTEVAGSTVSGTVLTDANGQALISVPSGAQEIFVSEDPNSTIAASNGFLLDYEPYDDIYTQSIIIDVSTTNYELTFYNCPCLIIDGYKFSDNDCSCDFTDGDEPLANWPIYISAGYLSMSTGPGQPGFTGDIAELYTDADVY